MGHPGVWNAVCPDIVCAGGEGTPTVVMSSRSEETLAVGVRKGSTRERQHVRYDGSDGGGLSGSDTGA